MSVEQDSSQSRGVSYAELGVPAKEAADRHRQHVAAILVSRGCLPELVAEPQPEFDPVTPEVASDAA